MGAVALAIDMEPDPRLVYDHDSDHWRGIERTLSVADGLRERLESLTGSPVNFTWMLRMDPQIAHAYGTSTFIGHRFERQWKELAQRGDDVGLHTHLYRLAPDSGTWVTEYGDPQWEEHCLAEAMAAYREVFGRECEIHSFGDRWLSETAVAALERYGIRADLTAEPGMTQQSQYLLSETLNGHLPDFSTTPHQPWHPAVDDWCRDDAENGRNVLLVPVSTYRMPAYLLPTRHASLLMRRLSGDTPTADDYVQKWVRVCPGQRNYVFRLACRQLRKAAVSPVRHFVLRSNQFLDSEQRISSNLEWLATNGFDRAASFLSMSGFLSSHSQALA